jgi:hypothetical protein
MIGTVPVHMFQCIVSLPNSKGRLQISTRRVLPGGGAFSGTGLTAGRKR